MSEVAIRNVGPIEEIIFDLPPGRGGVKVLKATSGSGKTTVLRALSGLVCNDKESLTGLTPRDGEQRGEVSGLGRTVRIGQKATTGGETEVPHLGRLDLSLLVDPKVTDPAARLKARVRLLASMGGVAMTPKDLLGEHYETFAKDIDIEDVKSLDDPVAMADKIKRSIDSLALQREREAERLRGMAQAKRQEAGDVAELETRLSYEGAVVAHRQSMKAASEAASRRERWLEITAKNSEIEQQLAEMERAEDITEDPIREVETLQALVAQLETDLAKAKSDLQQAKSLASLAKTKKDMRDKLRSQITDPGEPVTEAYVAECVATEEKALKILNIASTIEKRRQALTDSRESDQKARDCLKFASLARDIGKQVQAEVQRALPDGPIKVEDGELVVYQDKRSKSVPFDELSTGERWKVAMQYAISTVGEGGLVPLSQESWQALSPNLRDDIAKQCRDAKVWLISAEVAEGPIRVEEYEVEDNSLVDASLFL